MFLKKVDFTKIKTIGAIIGNDAGTAFILNKCIDDGMYSATIIKTKYLHKEKCRKFDWLCLRKEDIEKIVHWDCKTRIVLNCTCYSELLMLEKVEDSIILSIWDNYYLKHKKYLDNAILLTKEQFRAFVSNIREKEEIE